MWRGRLRRLDRAHDNLMPDPRGGADNGIPRTLWPTMNIAMLPQTPLIVNSIGACRIAARPIQVDNRTQCAKLNNFESWEVIVVTRPFMGIEIPSRPAAHSMGVNDE